MDNKVGSKVPTEAEIAALVGELKAIKQKIEGFTVALQPEQRAATTKMRSGGEAIVAKIGQLATEHGVALPELSVEGMQADLTLAQRLAPLAGAAHELSQRLDDTILEAHSECWWATTAYYTTLARMAGANATLAAALKSVVEFFAIGRRKKG